MSKITSTNKPSDSMLTNEQWASVSSKGDNLLISASAGSGKTKVLTTRVLEYLKAGQQIDQLLIVTFTNAAARDMKEKIRQSIQKELKNSTDYEIKQHLQNQLFKVGSSYISTIHSFCLRVIERYYYLVDFDPVFRQLTDPTEILIIKEDVWEELFSELLTLEDEEAKQRYEEFFLNYGNDREINALYEMVDQLYTFAMAKPDPEKWLYSLSHMYDMGNGLIGSEIYQKMIKPQLLDTLTIYLNTAKNLLNESEFAGPDLEATTKVLREDLEKIQQFYQWIEEDQLERVVDETLRFKFSPWKNAKGEAKEFSQNLKTTRDDLKKGFTTFLNKFFSQPIGQQEAFLKEAKNYIELLVDITLKFKKKFEEYKYSRQLVDFNDLEQLTIKILRTQEDEYSIAAEYYQQLFFEVMVDEYQDTNEVQEEILRLITRQHRLLNEKNYVIEPSSYMFMVGDVKQSIYGFRQADPTLFQDKYLNFAEDIGGGLITLAKNFRSRNEVLQATNLVFEQIMRLETSGIPYAGKEALEYGFTNYPENKEMNSELILIDSEKEASDQSMLQKSYDKDERMAYTITQRIKKLFRENLKVYDKDLARERELHLGDIVILTRTNSAAESIKNVFQNENIPVVLSKSQNFLKSIEVTTMIALLKIIDNPHQDIPLVTVLRSPIVNLNEVDLARIRIQDKKSNFYEAYLSYLEADFEDPINVKLKHKLLHFDQMFNKWRNLANKFSVSQLIHEIYQDTLYDSYVLGLSGGVQRQANLQALYERAATYEKTSFKGLFRFIRFIEKIQEKENDLIEPEIHGGIHHAVRVMTIHESKGQEFPIVFLAQMDRKLNQPEKSPIALHKDLGIGITYQNFQKHVKFKLWPRLMIEEQIRRDELEEEMRVLYVAMTRAEQKLIMVGHAPDREKISEKWTQVANRATNDGLAEVDVYQANSYLDWVGPAVILDKQQIIHPTWLTLDQLEAENQTSFEGNLTDFDSAPVASVQENDEEIERVVEEALDIIKSSYTHQAATETAPFQSVSEIKRFFEDPDLKDYQSVEIPHEAKGVLRGVGRYTIDSFEPPKFMKKEATHLESQDIGRIVHLILQKINIEEAQNYDQLVQEFYRLVDRKIVKKEWLKDMPFEKIEQIFHSDFGQLIIKHKDSLRREVPFSLMRDASNEFANFVMGQDYYLIKGIVDGYFETPKGIVLFDYKTDRVAHLNEKEAERTLLSRYSGQLRLYRLALEVILEKKVVSTKIISIDLGKVIEVP